jgi:peptidoglycan/LPS O-acetylase OafA/YrhL
VRSDVSTRADLVESSPVAPEREERKFRPDVQGLRAVAVLLVLLYHANWTVVSGGYVGVDVFFVISGFVITGVLLRERGSSGRTSLRSFYGRRARRIIPAATLVILATVVATYVFLGVLAGDRTAVDGRWAAIFLVNFHFASEGTNYLAAQNLPSPLQNFWSLSVEEQFYLVYPTLFLLLAAVRTRISLRTRLAIGLVVVMIASFALSVTQTNSNPTVAYFSPFTRAWELALGGLVAVGTQWLLKLPARIGVAATWLGLGAVIISAVTLTSQSAYPGSLVAIPVIGAAMIIAGGTVASRSGAESLLGFVPLGWIGNMSYSLYLWHWPILIIAAEYQDKTSLTFAQNLPWIGVAFVLSIISYQIVENPIRHSKFIRRNRWASLTLGVVLIVVTVVGTTLVVDRESAGGVSLAKDKITAGTTTQVAQLVAAAPQIQKLPIDLTPDLVQAPQDYGAVRGPCNPGVTQLSVPSCVFGDPNGKKTMVLYGDSHAQMWFQAMNNIAIAAHWRLVILGKGYCMANHYPPRSQLGDNAVIELCQTWQSFAYKRIRQLKPNLVVITQEVQTAPDRRPYTAAQWQQALERTIHRLSSPQTKFIVLGNIPKLKFSPPDCLAQHPSAIQICSTHRPLYPSAYEQAELHGVTAMGGRYISVTPWFCSTRCTSVVGHYELYLNELHVTQTYTLFLQNVLAQQLDLARY